MMTFSLARGHCIAIVVQKTEVEHQIAGCDCHYYGLLSPCSRPALSLGTLKNTVANLGRTLGIKLSG
jgi:hypothetical protein